MPACLTCTACLTLPHAMKYKQNSNWDQWGGLFKSQSRQTFTCGNYPWIIIEQQQLTLAEKPSQEDLLAPLSTSGLFTETTQVLTASEPHTPSQLWEMKLYKKKRLDSSSPALQPAATSKEETPLPSLTWTTKRGKQKNRTRYTGLAFVHRRVCTLGLMPEGPLFSWDAAGSLLQAQRRQESVLHLFHGVTCCNPDKIHIRVHSGTHTHMRWDSFKFSSTAMLLEF